MNRLIRDLVVMVAYIVTLGLALIAAILFMLSTSICSQ